MSGGLAVKHHGPNGGACGGARSGSPHEGRRTVRRSELRRIVPLADTTIYDMEQRGEFPRRFNLSPRCVVWDLSEVLAWVDQRRAASDAQLTKRATPSDVRQRKVRPVRVRDRA